MSHFEEGRLKSIGPDDTILVMTVRGSYSYKHNGTTYTVDYVADENGYRTEKPIC